MMIVVAVGRGWEPVGTLAEASERAGRWGWRLAVAPASGGERGEKELILHENAYL